MTLYAVIGAVISTIVALAGAVFWGGRYTKHKRDAEEAKREMETYQKSMERQHEVDGLPDSSILDRLRKRARE